MTPTTPVIQNTIASGTRVKLNPVVHPNAANDVVPQLIQC